MNPLVCAGPTDLYNAGRLRFQEGYVAGADRPLEGRVVLVTGGGVRLGRALSEGLARAGATVAVHYHGSEQGASEAVSAIKVDGNHAAAFRADLTRKAEV